MPLGKQIVRKPSPLDGRAGRAPDAYGRTFSNAVIA